MDKYKELAENLKNLAPARTVTLMQGIVEDVDGRTCSVRSGGLLVSGVRLRASAAPCSGELLVVPRKGSAVLFGSLSGDLTDLAVLAVDEAESVTFHGGGQGGLVLIRPLTERLNAIERDLNALKRACTAWVPAPQDGGAALKAGLTDWAASPLKESLATDYENKSIRQ